MTKENNKNYLLPSYFEPILPENTEVLEVVVKDSLVKVYFSKELENITKEQSEQMIEAIIYTITDENILGIEIYVENNLLKYVPHTNKELPTILTKDFGINKEYELTNTSDINKVMINYYADDSSIIPITKYVNDDREKLEIVFDNLLSVNNNNLISLLENLKINNYKIENDIIYIDIDTDITKKELELIAKSLYDNYKNKKLIISINGNKKYTKILEK